MVQSGLKAMEQIAARTLFMRHREANMGRFFDINNAAGFFNVVYLNSSSKPPTVHTMPTKFSGRSQKFTAVRMPV